MQVPVLQSPQNHRFTYSYSQPAEYHFCLDSVIFAKFVAEKAARLAEGKVLDLCAGCGVIGFELAHHMPQIREMDFVELQPIFREHFEENQRITGKPHFRFLNMDYRSLVDPQYAGVYDLIVANPPYFYPTDGKLTPCAIKNQCRFFTEGSLEDLALAAEYVLRPGGEFYLLVKDGSVHGRDSLALIQSQIRSEVTVAAVIRGTLVLHIRKTAA